MLESIIILDFEDDPMVEENMEGKRAAAMRLMGQPEQIRQPEPVRNFLEMRPVVQQSVNEQERRATQVVTATFQLFRDAIEKGEDPTLRREFRGSSLNTMLS
jgi:hypothetical protein